MDRTKEVNVIENHADSRDDLKKIDLIKEDKIKKKKVNKNVEEDDILSENEDEIEKKKVNENVKEDDNLSENEESECISQPEMLNESVTSDKNPITVVDSMSYRDIKRNTVISFKKGGEWQTAEVVSRAGKIGSIKGKGK